MVVRCSRLRKSLAFMPTNDAAGTAEALAKQKAEAAELARLRRENRRLEQENEILKRAAAFFAREVGT